jgi:hypothetical protein
MDLHRGAAGVGKDGVDALALQGLAVCGLGIFWLWRWFRWAGWPTKSLLPFQTHSIALSTSLSAPHSNDKHQHTPTARAKHTRAATRTHLHQDVGALAGLALEPVDPPGGGCGDYETRLVRMRVRERPPERATQRQHTTATASLQLELRAHNRRRLRLPLRLQLINPLNAAGQISYSQSASMVAWTDSRACLSCGLGEGMGAAKRESGRREQRRLCSGGSSGAGESSGSGVRRVARPTAAPLPAASMWPGGRRWPSNQSQITDCPHPSIAGGCCWRSASQPPARFHPLQRAARRAVPASPSAPAVSAPRPGSSSWAPCPPSSPCSPARRVPRAWREERGETQHSKGLSRFSNQSRSASPCPQLDVRHGAMQDSSPHLLLPPRALATGAAGVRETVRACGCIRSST